MLLKKYAFALSLALMSIHLHAGDNPVRDYPAQKVSEHVYMIEGPLGEPSVENQGFMNNPAFVVRPEGVVVIDPGSSQQAGEMVARQIRKITQAPVTDVLITHVHGDHWLGNQGIRNHWPEARIYAHPKMIIKAKAGDDRLWIDLMDRLTEGYTKGTKAVIPDQEVVDDSTLKLNGLTYKIYAPEKAHSGTDIMIEIVEDAVMILGDNVTYKRIARMDDGTFQGNINACEVALVTEASVFMPGHGPVGGREVVESFKQYLETVYATTQRFYDEGLQDYEMKPQVIEELASFHDWNGFEEAIGKHISLIILEIEANF
jgi:glyoxylase-like metal-dependent hydrolase (beta-lactamase superfamily II)